MVNRDIMGLYSMLSEDEYTTAETLARTLHVSSKTVRNQLKNLNSALCGYDMEVESKNGAGYRLKVRDEDKRREFDESLWEQERLRSGIPDSPEERINYLVNYLLHFSDEYVKLDDLGALLYVSNKTLTANLKEVEKVLKDYDLVLARKPKYGIKVEGREFDKRLCIAGNDPRAEGVVRVLDGSDKNAGNEEISRIEDAIQDCLSRYPFIISNIAYRDLVIHLMIALHRMQEGHYVEPMDMAAMDDKTSYQMAADILDNLKGYYGVEITESETEYIAIQLEAKQTLQAVLPEGENDSYVVVSPEVDELEEAMLSAVYSAFRFDFRQDFDLILALSRHLVPMIVRLQHGIRLNNPLLSEIKQQYALAYTMATTACVVLSQKYHTVVREEEIGYIALLLALALERKRSQISKKNILMVCATGQASSQLMQYRYQMEFGPYINSISVCDVGRVADYDFTDVDYVFTTVPITVKLPVPVQEVEYFLKSSSVATVRRVLTENYDHTITDIYREELFLAHQHFRTKDEALQIMCDYITEHGYADKTLIGSVRAREEIARTAFGNLVAMPHPIEIVGDRPFVCVALLDEPIQWIDEDPDSLVQAIFLVSVANVKNYDVQEFYQVTTCLFMDEANIKTLLKEQSFDTLLMLLQEEQKIIEKE